MLCVRHYLARLDAYRQRYGIYPFTNGLLMWGGSGEWSVDDYNTSWRGVPFNGKARVLHRYRRPVW